MSLRITVSWSPAPREVSEVRLALADGATVRDAIELAKVRDQWNAAPANLDLGIWGRAAKLDDRLRDHDRVEIYRPLRADPKTARRERFATQGSRAAGLFAQRPKGAKPGY